MRATKKNRKMVTAFAVNAGERMVQFTYTKSYRDAENILTRLNDYRVWGVDTETNGSDPRLNDVLMSRNHYLHAGVV